MNKFATKELGFFGFQPLAILLLSCRMSFGTDESNICLLRALYTGSGNLVTKLIDSFIISFARNDGNDLSSDIGLDDSKISSLIKFN